MSKRINLHDYQKEVSDIVWEDLINNNDASRAIVSLAPGMGKTVIAAGISHDLMDTAEHADKQTNILFAVPKIDLASQARVDFLDYLEGRKDNVRTLFLASDADQRNVYESDFRDSTITLNPDRIIREVKENNSEGMHNVVFVIYNSLVNKLDRMREIDWEMAFYDEAHNLCTNDDEVKRTVLTDPNLDIFPKTLMLTATPSSFLEMYRRGVTNPVILEDAWEQARLSYGMDNDERFGRVIAHKTWRQGIDSRRLVKLEAHVIHGVGNPYSMDIDNPYHRQWAEALDSFLEALTKDREFGTKEEPGLPRVMVYTSKGYEEQEYICSQQKLFNEANARIFSVHSEYAGKYVEYTAPGVHHKVDDFYDIVKNPEEDMIIFQHRILAEGTNIPALTSMFMSRDYGNESSMIQCASRVGRAYTLTNHLGSFRKVKGRVYFFQPYQDAQKALSVSRMLEDFMDTYYKNPTTFTKVQAYDKITGKGNRLEIARDPLNPGDDNIELPLVIKKYSVRNNRRDEW